MSQPKTPVVARVRMFAGPNGSGKSTLKNWLPAPLFGSFINPDEIEKSIRESGVFDLAAWQMKGQSGALIEFLENSPFLRQVGLSGQIQDLRAENEIISFENVAVNAYFASVIADWLRQKLIERRASFTFETVMSSPDKIAFLKTAQASGFRTYLYFVATQDPRINIARVRNRVLQGGHDVPEDKIVARYARSLALLPAAIAASSRTYIFDNSGSEQIYLAEITDGRQLQLQTQVVPVWFQNVLEKIAFERSET